MSTFIPMYCETCPETYPLPRPNEVPKMVWFCGSAPVHEDLYFHVITYGIPMDMGHDFSVQKDSFRYFYSGGDESWIVFEYEDGENSFTCKKCKKSVDLPRHARFCPMCGECVQPGPPWTYAHDTYVAPVVEQDVMVRCPNMCHNGREPVTGTGSGAKYALWHHIRCKFCKGTGTVSKRLYDEIKASI